ncbi:hypothetical protein Lalb_Chr00c29g0407911 (mitochondrion) [Lupinus albus]|uniref:Uncharacterized protein n=1 Tax=Lupinus albus TaxID=3870 RepID=A0A6A4MVM2_LUPAL|nr:hypothetical protein Lalb_Chr00c29g0407911 [Lupinus albus]
MLKLWRMHLSSLMHKLRYQLVVIEFLLWFHMRNQYEYNLHVQLNYELEVFLLSFGPWRPVLLKS